VRVYSRALGAAEVKTISNNLGTANVGHSNAGNSSGLVGLLDHLTAAVSIGRKNEVADMSGQGNTGQLISMSTTTHPSRQNRPGDEVDGTDDYVNIGNVSYSIWRGKTGRSQHGSRLLTEGPNDSQQKLTSWLRHWMAYVITS